MRPSTPCQRQTYSQFHLRASSLLTKYSMQSSYRFFHSTWTLACLLNLLPSRLLSYCRTMALFPALRAMHHAIIYLVSVQSGGKYRLHSTTPSAIRPINPVDPVAAVITPGLVYSTFQCSTSIYVALISRVPSDTHFHPSSFSTRTFQGYLWVIS